MQTEVTQQTVSSKHHIIFIVFFLCIDLLVETEVVFADVVETGIAVVVTDQ